MNDKPATSEKINCLVLGSGGREHAIGWKLKQSPKCGKVYFAPGNGGTAEIGENLDLAIEPVTTKNVDAIDYFCRHHDVSLVVIGPEDPLSHGLADRLKSPGRTVFGPLKSGARLEGDKAFAKQLMKASSVPTADARTFVDYERAVRYIEAHEEPQVVKAAGLCKGKGVYVCKNQQDALDALKEIMVDQIFGDEGKTVVIEERLVGQEVSILALVDGKSIYVLDPSQDHKQVGEGDVGPNTGGMGAYCPTPIVDEAAIVEIEKDILVPIVDTLRREEIEFKGVLYAGLMLTAGGPKVLEFNVRFGDPECQPLMMRLHGDLIDILTATCEGQLDAMELDLSWDEKVACCVVMCSGGYPGKYENGKPITGIEDAEADPDVKVFHAGTKIVDDQLVTNGGRVLNVTALGSTLEEAQDKANAACEKIKFEGAFFRRDIGHRVMKKSKTKQEPVSA